MSTEDTLVTEDIWSDLKKRLNDLKAVCYPPTASLHPSIRFKTQSDFLLDDHLKWGRSSMPIYPHEISNIWEDRQTLRNENIDYICVQNQKWYFNMHDKVGRFFHQNGTRLVEIEFPYWMQMSDVIKTKGCRTSIFNLLSLCASESFPDDETAQNCFSDELCHTIYQKNPPREAIEVAILEILETLSTQTNKYMEENHVTDIAKEAAFKRFVKSRTFPVNIPEIQRIREFLAGERKQKYILAEKYGFIKNGRKISSYEDIRDHVRHSRSVPLQRIKPEQIYNDFCIALHTPETTEVKDNNLSHLSDNIAIALRLDTLSFIWDILDQYVDPNLKKKKNKESYYTDLVQKGILDASEVAIIRQSRLNHNAVAHANSFVEDAREKVMEDKDIENVAYAINKRHEAIIQQKLKQSKEH